MIWLTGGILLLVWGLGYVVLKKVYRFFSQLVAVAEEIYNFSQRV